MLVYIHSFNKGLLSAYYKAGTVLGIGDITLNKTYKISTHLGKNKINKETNCVISHSVVRKIKHSKKIKKIE